MAQVHFDVRQTNITASISIGCDDRRQNSANDTAAAAASAAAAAAASVGRFLGTLSLTHSVLTYNELKEDRNVLVYVPQGSFYPGSRFRVPVKLQVHSELRHFVVKYATSVSDVCMRVARILSNLRALQFTNPQKNNLTFLSHRRATVSKF